MPLESVGNAQVIRKMIGNVPIVKESMGSFVVYEKEMYNITASIVDGAEEGGSVIVEDCNSTVTIVPDVGYALPQSVVVVGASYTYDNTTGIIVLSNPTGNVSITAECEPVATTYSITYNITNATVSPQPSTISPGETITYTMSFTYSSPFTSATGATLINIGNDQYELSNPTENVTVVVSSSTPCLLKDTDVLLANGTIKKIQDISYDDLVLTYNSYLKRFIGEYPCVITETSYEHITNNFKRMIFDDDNHLDIACLHTICVRENNEDVFTKIAVWENSDSIIGKDVVYYDNGKTKTHKVVRIDTLSNDNKVSAYNVFVPMHGTIITNNILTGGDFLISSKAIERGYNKDFTGIDSISSYINDTYIIEDYQKIKEMCKDLPLNVFTSSFLQYYNLCNKYLEDTTMSKEELDGLNYTLSLWKQYYKPFKDVCKVKIDDDIHEVNAGDEFTFPNTYSKYLDITNYKVYNAGDTKKIYTNTVLIGITTD